MAKIILDEMKNTRDALRGMLVSVQEACRMCIRIVNGGEDTGPLLDRVLKLEDQGDSDMVRITEELSEIVGKLFLAGLLKRAVVCDAVVAHDTEAMLDMLQHVAENWTKVTDSDPDMVTDEVKILVDSMLQNCIVMIEKAIDILDGKDISEHNLAFIKELDENINQANITAHETLLTAQGDKRAIIRMLRIVKHVENLGDKIKSVSMYLLYIRTGDFIEV